MHFFGHMVEEHFDKLIGIRFLGAKVGLIEGERFESLFGGDVQVERQELLWTEQPVLVPHEAFLRKIDLVNLIRAFEVHRQDVACLVLGDDPCSDHFSTWSFAWLRRTAKMITWPTVPPGLVSGSDHVVTKEVHRDFKSQDSSEFFQANNLAGFAKVRGCIQLETAACAKKKTFSEEVFAPRALH